MPESRKTSFSYTDLIGAYAELLRDPGYDHGADDLVDMRGIEHFGVTQAGLENIMALFAPVDQLGIQRGDSAPAAIVIDRPTIRRGLSDEVNTARFVR